MTSRTARRPDPAAGSSSARPAVPAPGAAPTLEAGKDGTAATPDVHAADREGPGRRTLSVPGVESLSVLASDGQYDASLDPGLSTEDLLRVHRAMVLTRVFDVRMLNMQRQGRMGTFAPGYGQEATQIGQVFPLEERDWFSPSYRSFGAQLWRGWEMERLFLLWSGHHEGFPPPPGVNDLPFSIVIGSHPLPATGVAMGMRYRAIEAGTGEDDLPVMLVNFGDGALSQGAVAEAFNYAEVNRAPVVFVVENNGWAISMPVAKQQGHGVLAQRGVGFDLPSIRVDGNDILAMIAATREAVDRARRGDGPTLIEAVTYRMGVHTTADDPKVYRDDAEVEAWKSKCPIARFEAHLKKQGLLDDAKVQAVHDACDAEVLAARDRFEADKKPRPEEIFDYVYETLPPELEQQKQEYLEKLRRKGAIG